MFPLLYVENGPVKRTGELGRNQTIFSTGKTPVSSVPARGVLGAAGRRDPLELALLNKVREPGRGEAPGHGQGFGLACARESQDGVRPDHEWGFGLAHARSALGPAGRKDHSRLPYLKRARECAFPVKWSLIPLPTKMRTASQQNPGPHQTACWTASR